MNAAGLQLPGWVNWMAQDYSGVWWGFEAEPNQGHDFWYENEVGRYLQLAQEPVNPDWRDSLQKITWPDRLACPG